MCRCGKTPGSVYQAPPESKQSSSSQPSAAALVTELKLGEVESVRCMLLEGRFRSLEEQDERQDGTALTWACCLGLEDVVEILVTLGARTDARTAWHSTPLHVACDFGHASIVRILLSCSVDVNAVTSSGDTACHLAAYRGFTPIVRLLLGAGANPSIKNNNRKTVYHETMASGKTELISLMKGYSKSSRHSTEPETKKDYDVTSCGVQITRTGEACLESGHKYTTPPSVQDMHNSQNKHRSSCVLTKTKSIDDEDDFDHRKSICVFKTTDPEDSDKHSNVVEDNLDSFVSIQTSKSFYKPKVLPY